MLVTIDGLNKSFGDKTVLTNINLKIEEKSRIGLIGANGAGKSTLLNILCGRLEGDSGSVYRAFTMSLGFLEQNSGLQRESTIYNEMLSVFAPLLELQEEMHALEQQLSGIDTQSEAYERLTVSYANKQTAFEQGGGYLIEVKIKTILNGMGFQSVPLDTQIQTLSGGEKTRLAMARLLLEEPNLLILDEPTNHLDFKTLMWLEEYLGTYNGAIVVVSHDRYFLDKVVSEIYELERNTLTGYPGNYSKFLILKQERVARLQKEYEQQQLHIAELQEYIDKNMARASTSNSAKGRLKALEKIEVMERPSTAIKRMNLRFETDKVPYKELLKINNMALSVGEKESRKQLFQHLNLEVTRGERVAIIGTNGIGKSSLLKAIQGMIPIDSGSYAWGQNASIGYYEQENGNLHPEKTVLDELWDRHLTYNEVVIRTALGNVLLTGDNVYKKVKVISGGERAKLAFAVLMLERANVLILDEPTNHLDLAAKEDLEQALLGFEGTLLFVSHDRYLLNRVPTRIVELHNDGIKSYNGNYDAYVSEVTKEKQLKVEGQPAEILKQIPNKHEGYYKSKEQKSAEARIKNRIKELERLIADTEAEIAEHEHEMTLENVYTDYLAMQQHCAELEVKRAALSKYYDEWAELSS
ncbi:ATP-binding cassette domain-containing protein [Acetanaerobacterium elongatum]|uniref:ATP-binding cassette, subfamily F, member 3 n=1 Tax=Acetanaerobacterium elongatum TaxID=258515 RepID=A0A1H0BDE6_9FIRM|nr:ATP-binding cassette domain-containing protein [Acetanaerobacterium elongatum]SDN43684.1 ATP-binding cassette, subfamily F, member 3 [Acetanaerobacterium elongatum]